MVQFKKYFHWALYGLVVVGAFLLFRQCKTGTRTTVVYKKGFNHIVKVVTGKPDTVVKKVAVHHWHASKIKLVHDTTHHYYTANDSMTVNGISIAIRDTLQGDSIRRVTNVYHIDSTKFISRVDTVFSLRVDTLKMIERHTWKDLKTGFVIGYISGYATKSFVGPH